MLHVTIIGGGVCGATIARLLSPHVKTTILEKSGRPSGRVASLLFRGTVIDHGPPCFALQPNTRAFFGEVLGEDLLPIPGKFVQVGGDGTETADCRQLMYVKASANALGAGLINGLPGVTLKTKSLVTSDAKTGHLSISGAPLPSADATIVTAPLPQAAALFPDFLDAAEVRSSFAPALMAAVAYPAGTAVSDGVYARTWADGASATRESLKARGAREDIFLVRGTEAFSRARLEDDPAVWTGELSELLAERWPGLEGAEATDTFAKRWRYAEPTAGFSLSSANSPVLQRGSIFFAGDALGAQPGRQGIDAAFFSARATAAAVARLLGLGL